MNYKKWMTLQFLSSQVPLYLMLGVYFTVDLRKTWIYELIVVIQLILGILASFVLLCKLKINNNQKGTKVTLKKVKFKLSSAMYPVLIPLLIVTCSKGNWHAGMISSLFVQVIMYVITIKSSDPLYNFMLLTVAKLQVYKVVDSDQLYYCLVKSDSDKVERNCLKLTQNWLVVSK